MMYSMTIFASLLGSALGFSSIPDAMKIPCSTPVTVTVTVKDTWCKESHPQDFVDDIGGDGPINGLFELGEKPGAHISPPVVYTHGASAAPVWGQYADQGGAKVLKVCLVLVAPQQPPGVNSPGSCGCLTTVKRPYTPRRGQHRNHW